MTETRTALFTALLIGVSIHAWAQPAPAPRFTREASFSVGLGHVFRYEDKTLGDRLNIGGSVGVFHRSGAGLEVEIDRTLGFSPGLADCAIQGTFCYGATHAGIRSPTVVSVGVQYRFKGGRVRPYVTAGLGALVLKTVRPDVVGGPDLIHSESEVRDTGFGPDLGVGLRIAFPRGFSISPEVRWLDAPWLAGSNLAVTRLLVRTAYAW
jgi:hypothetical protein